MNTLAARDKITLSDKAKKYVLKSKAPSTLRVYGIAWREFRNFAGGRGEAALPVSVSSVIEYLAALADGGAKVSTIKVKLAAIAWAHRAAGHPDPTVCEEVKALMQGIARELKSAPNKKAPARLDDIKAMIATLPDNIKGKRDRALLLVGFYGGFRRSELVALDVKDLAFGRSLSIYIKSSKTDQEGNGAYKHMPNDGGDYCPVGALRAWLDEAGIDTGPVFRRIDRHGNVLTRLKPQGVSLVIKGAAREAGLDAKRFSGHSLRSGFVSASMDKGVSDSDIAQQTGHKDVQTMREYRQNTGAGALRACRAIAEDDCSLQP